MRHNIGGREHGVTFTDADMIFVLMGWLPTVDNADSPTIEDSLRFRDALAKRVGQDLSMVCLIWLRNEFVAVRKNSRLTGGKRHVCREGTL